MEKFLDKMGLYDLWVVLIPGIIFQFGTKSLYHFMTTLPGLLTASSGTVEKLGLLLEIDITPPSNIYDFLILLTLSYLCGLILHELSSILKCRIIYRKGDPRTLLLNKTSGTLNCLELHRLMPLLKFLNGGEDFSQSDPEKLKAVSKYLFHQMNQELQSKKKAGDYVKLNIIYNMCATICVVFVFMALIVFAFGAEYLINKEYFSFFYSFIIEGFIIASLLLLISRSKRYYKYWVRNVVFAFEDLYRNNIDSSAAQTLLEHSKV